LGKAPKFGKQFSSVRLRVAREMRSEDLAGN
jgi:hypothetical protein